MTALGQGYGLTEFDTFGTLLETNVTVITNEECIDILRSNSSMSPIVRKLLIESTNGNPGAIIYGLTSQLLCAKGIQNEEVSES